MELLHIHNAPSAVHKSILIHLSYVPVTREYVLLGLICIFILVELLAYKQTVDVGIITLFRETSHLIELSAKETEERTNEAACRSVA